MPQAPKSFGSPYEKTLVKKNKRRPRCRWAPLKPETTEFLSRMLILLEHHRVKRLRRPGDLVLGIGDHLGEPHSRVFPLKFHQAVGSGLGSNPGVASSILHLVMF